MRPTLNLATRTYVNRRALYMLYTFLVGAGVFSLVLNGIYFYRLQRQYQQVSGYLGEVEGAFAKLQGENSGNISPAALKKQQETILFANELLAQDSFRWTAMLDRLEAVVPEGVSINSITPDYKNRELRLNGNALNVSRLQTFIDQIVASDDFAEVYLLNQAQSETRERTGQVRSVVNFSLVMKGAF